MEKVWESFCAIASFTSEHNHSSPLPPTLTSTENAASDVKCHELVGPGGQSCPMMPCVASLLSLSLCYSPPTPTTPPHPPSHLGRLSHCFSMLISSTVADHRKQFQAITQSSNSLLGVRAEDTNSLMLAECSASSDVRSRLPRLLEDLFSSISAYTVSVIIYWHCVIEEEKNILSDVLNIVSPIVETLCNYSCIIKMRFFHLTLHLHSLQ